MLVPMRRVECSSLTSRRPSCRLAVKSRPIQTSYLPLTGLTSRPRVASCFRRKGKVRRAISSTLYKRRQETAEQSLRLAMDRLQAGVTFLSAATLHGTKNGVDELVARSDGAEQRLSRQERKKRMLEHQEIPPDQITYFDDMVLGVGGFAKVQLVEYQETISVAKVVRMPEDADSGAVGKTTKMFVSELHAMVQLRSQYTVNVFGAVTSAPGKLVLVMESIEGGDLRTFLAATSDPLESNLAYGLARDIAKGMQFLHSKNAIHGDLKSPNVLLTRGNTAKIADCGTTRTIEEITSMATSGGTSWRYGAPLKWAAPEVLNDERARAKSDVYSYGIVVWEIVSGQLPWQGVNMQQLMVTVGSRKRPVAPAGAPPPLTSLMVACWVNNPQDRVSFDDVLVMLTNGQATW